jgi:exopolysaccharide biosynthesis polyprenyl glycosylphosphotransferase
MLAQLSFDTVPAQDRRRHQRTAEDEMVVQTITAVPVGSKPTLARAVKRCLGASLSALAIVMLSPLLIVIALLVKLTSKGPVLFVQERLGEGGRPFAMYKFRTMVVNAEALKQQLAKQNEASGPVFKIRRDPRITTVGRFLRKFSLDELPQLFNVLKGDMSIVGPRPPIASEVRHYRAWQLRRLSVKPGLTCIWQVSGRSGINFEDWMRLDLRYIDHWSLGLDLKLVLKTIPAVVKGVGAY